MLERPPRGAWVDDLLATERLAQHHSTLGEGTRRVTATLRERDHEDLRAGALWLFLTLEGRARDHGGHLFVWNSETDSVLAALARRKLGWDADEVRALWSHLARLLQDKGWERTFPQILRLPLAAAEELDPGDVEPLRPTLQALATRLTQQGAELYYGKAEQARFVRRVRDLLASGTAGDLTLEATILGEGDAFGPAVRNRLLSSFEPAVAVPLLRHLADYTGAVTPTKKWRERTRALLAEQPDRARVARQLLEQACAHRDVPVTVHRYGGSWDEHVFVTPDTATLLRAAVWAVHATGADWAPALLGRAAVHCGGGLGGAAGTPRCSQVASSAIAALGELGEQQDDVVVAQLSRCQAKLRNRTLLKSLDKTLHAVAARAGLTPGQLLERSVPTFGLDAEGGGGERQGVEHQVGEYTARIYVDTSGTRLTWRSPTGRAVKTTPKPVREQHAEVLSELRATVKEAGKVLATERSRLEGLLASGRTWGRDDWVHYYVGHPLTGVHARLLLWQVDDGDTWLAGLPVRHDGGWGLAAVDGTAVPVADGSQLRLWHPIDATAAEVRTWRDELSRREVRQPFKQAFREVYLLTPAEETTDTYSNRFAGHILRYRQAGALMRARGWVGNHLGYWDGGFEGEATREVGEDGWRAKFYYDLVENSAVDGYETPGLCASDQVRFERFTGTAAGASWEPARMADVPPLVFTEAMRDVDLFVGVTSIAADPEWVDGGEDRHRDYWYRTTFGDLTESAQVRREALQRLMPRTRIADRVRVTEKFLEVDGSLHTYRIHLGSGNILMSPNDAYLCIVTGRREGAAERVFLPFEEDGGMLSVIVSKAFLLADDASITDASITSQLRTG